MRLYRPLVVQPHSHPIQKQILLNVQLPQCQRFGHHTSEDNLMRPENQGLQW